MARQVAESRRYSGRVVAEPGDRPRLVVVVPVEGVPADVGQPGLPAAERGLEVAQPQRPDVPLRRPVVQAHVLELEHHVHLGARRVGEQPRLLHGHAGHLADGEQRVRPGRRTPRGASPAGTRGCAARRCSDAEPSPSAVPGDRRAVVQAAVGGDVLGDHVDDVHAEAVDPAVEPPAHHRVDRLPDLGVLPVQVGLLAVEQVQVVLAAGLVELPGRAGEERPPVRRLGAGVRRPASRPRGGRHQYQSRLGESVDDLRLHEPRVLVAGVVDHQVHDQPHAARVQLRDQLVELRQRAEQRVDVLVVADVVAVVGLRRGVDRRQPQDVDAEVGQVVQPLQDAAEVADAVAVGVLERAGIDLVDDGAGPPRAVSGPSQAPNVWWTASTLLPSGSRKKTP